MMNGAKAKQASHSSIGKNLTAIPEAIITLANSVVWKK